MGNTIVQTRAFFNASSLTNLTLLASCNKFGLKYSYQSGALSNCTSLQNLNFKNFTLNTTSGDNTVAVGFAQINQQT